MKNYLTFNDYLKIKWGKRIGKISLNLGILCPHKLQNNGCTFCNDSSFLPYPASKNKSIDYQISYARNRLSKRYKTDSFYAYFQAGTNTYGDLDTLIKNYEYLLEKDFILGIIISTRPDYIDSNIIVALNNMMNKYKNKELWIELGLQSIYDKTLSRINRGHTYSDFKNTVKMINETSKFPICVHMIIGLPGETKEDIINGVKTLLLENNINSLKFHDLNILKGTKIENDYLKNNDEFLSFNEDSYAKFICDLLEHIPKNIIIMRLLSDHPSNLLIKKEVSSMPNKQNILQKINEIFEHRKSFQGKRIMDEKDCFN